VVNGYVLDIVVHENVQMSEVIVSDIMDSDHLPNIFPLADHVRTRNPLDVIDKFTDWAWFQSLASELILPRIHTILWEKADEVACDFNTSIASAYGLSTSRIPLLDLNKDIPFSESLLECKWRVSKLGRVTQEPVYKMAVNWVAKTIR
jgi:hypothetical protein